MQSPDLNLLFALDILLEEGVVVGAARRMNLSAPAMSRTLVRISEAVGDPIFVKVGRRMVPTPRALALREQVHSSVESARQLLQPEREVDLLTVKRHFNLHANDTFISAFGQALLERVRREAPHVLLRFSPESESEDTVLRRPRRETRCRRSRSAIHQDLRTLQAPWNRRNPARALVD